MRKQGNALNVLHILYAIVCETTALSLYPVVSHFIHIYALIN